MDDKTNSFHARSRIEWRKWLIDNHKTQNSVWLIIYKKGSGFPSVHYPEAVEEALCFGWVDSKPNRRDEYSYYQFFAKRNPKSNWSRINKEKVIRLTKQNLMADAGLKIVEKAKKNGSWDALNDVENHVIPGDLKKGFELNPKAYKNWEQFPGSVKRGILEWVLNAKRPETRAKRVEETIRLAEKNIRANQYRK